MPLVPADQFSFAGPTYLSASPVIDASRCINLYPDPGIASSKSQLGLIARPGLISFTTAPLVPGHSLWAGNGRLFASVGSVVQEYNSSGAVITQYTGTLTSDKNPTPMIANGTQLLLCQGYPYSATGTIYNLNPSGPTQDVVFNGCALEYLDGFYVAIATGASLAGTNPNQINVSANGDGTTWPALAYAIRTGASDLTIQLAVLNSLLYIFGQKSIEIWYDAGNAIFPFQRINGGTLNIGCFAANSVVKFSNTILWLGGADTGYAQVYMMQGTNPVRVSNAAIEYMISSQYSQPNMIYTKAYGYQEAGHTFYVLNFCSSNGTSTGNALVYDLTTGLWHERNWSVLRPTSFGAVPNFGAATVPNMILDEATGGIFYQSILAPTDSGASIGCTRIAPHAANENRWIRYPRFELDCDLGTANPQLSYSNDGGRNFNGWGYNMRQAQDQGAPGTFRRFYALQLGRSRDRVFSVNIASSSSALIRIAGAYLTAELG